MQGARSPWELAEAPCRTRHQLPGGRALDHGSSLGVTWISGNWVMRACADVFPSFLSACLLCLLTAHWESSSRHGHGLGHCPAQRHGIPLSLPASGVSSPSKPIISTGLGLRHMLTLSCRPSGRREPRRQWDYHGICKKDTQECTYEGVNIIPTLDGQPLNFFPDGTTSNELETLGLVPEVVSLGH